MDSLSKKVSYLKGYADGLDISPKSDEGKLITKMLEVLDEMAAAIDDLEYAQEETNDIIDELDESVFAIAEDIYGDDEYDDEYGDEDDFLDDYDEYDDEDSEDDYFEIQCPSCGEDVIVDFDMIDGNEPIVCPNCHEEIELEIDFEDDDDCGCGHEH